MLLFSFVVFKFVSVKESEISVRKSRVPSCDCL